MSNFKGSKKNKSYFEGWYFKHQMDNNTIAFIPGINIDSYGNKSAFIQVITNNTSYKIIYSYKEVSIDRNNFKIKIGNSTFSDKGINIDIKDKDISISGRIIYGEFTPLKSDIMGFFKHFPFMECNHGVLSLYHKTKGSININGETINLEQGIGYIEKDWGSSFPKTYLWNHCNYFKNEVCSIMVSIADIPFLGFNFKGCIAVVYYRGKEYRLATYNGVKILEYSKEKIEIQRRDYRLVINVKSELGQELLAPRTGEMTRTIYENPSCEAEYIFYCKEKEVFKLKSHMASFEFVE